MKERIRFCFAEAPPAITVVAFPIYFLEFTGGTLRSVDRYLHPAFMADGASFVSVVCLGLCGLGGMLTSYC